MVIRKINLNLEEVPHYQIGSKQKKMLQQLNHACHKEGDRDMVMVRLGEIIKPMKESFLVAYLNWSGIKEYDFNDVPNALKVYRNQNGLTENAQPDNVDSSPLSTSKTS